MSLASILTGVLDVVDVLGAVVVLFGGGAGAFALLRRRTGESIGANAAKGAAIGFIIGVPTAIAAAIWLR